jgi:photosystem II stability/assembly factor-like uncharacterized protein
VSAWAFLQSRVFWSTDIGWSGREIGPPGTPVRAAHFLDAARGWLVSGPTPANLAFQVLRTSDGGVSWQPAGAIPADEMTVDARPVSLDFINPQEGWLSLRLASSSNFHLGCLFHPTAGGLSWEALNLPGGGAIDFLDASEGWTWAGPEGNIPYQTLDGGLTWQPARAVPPGVLSIPDVPLDSLYLSSLP